jgi:AcrR family transcriptional regulator
MTLAFGALGDDDEPRREIIWAAAELFMVLGFGGTSIDAIAEKLGATKGRIYHHYRSKAEIYFDVQRVAMNRLMAQVEPIARERIEPQTRLRNMARAHVEMMLHELPIQKVAVQGLDLSMLGLRHTKASREIVRLRDDYEQMFCEVMDEGIRAGIFEDIPARMLSKPFFGALNWVTIWYKPRRLQEPEELSAIADMLADFAMKGVLREEKAT